MGWLHPMLFFVLYMLFLFFKCAAAEAVLNLRFGMRASKLLLMTGIVLAPGLVSAQEGVYIGGFY
ncbi:hypothetical protein SAMN04489856_1194, partial [Oleiphilus messinensis]